VSDPRRPDDTVICHECRAILGTIRRKPHGGFVRGGEFRPLVQGHDGVRAYLDPKSDTISLLCPSCGAMGRTFRLDRLHGLIVYLGQTLEVAC
jgi:hypothetical protein